MTDWWWAYLALGAFVGFFSGLLGIGGGSATVPVLAFVFAAKGFPPDHVVHLALGTGIATMLFTSVASVRSHHLRESVNWGVLRADGAGLGSRDFRRRASRRAARRAAPQHCVHGADFLLRLPDAPDADRDAFAHAAGNGSMSGFGAFIGFISSLSATGGRFDRRAFSGEAPHRDARGDRHGSGGGLADRGRGRFRLHHRRLAHAGLPPYSLGYVYLPALVGVVIASVVMAPLGAAVAHRTPGTTLRKVFAIVLFALATTMLVKFL